MIKTIFWGQPGKTNLVKPGECIVAPKRGTPAVPPLVLPVFIGPAYVGGETQDGTVWNSDESVRFTGADSYALIGPWPVGFAISAAGVVTGTWTPVASLAGLGVQAINADGTTDSNLFSVNVIAVPAPPIFDGVIPDISGTEAVAITPYDAAQHFGTGGLVVTYALVGAPAGLVIDAVTGQITGTVAAVSNTPGVTVTGTNVDGTATSNAFVVDIASVVAATNVMTVGGDELAPQYGFQSDAFGVTTGALAPGDIRGLEITKILAISTTQMRVQFDLDQALSEFPFTMEGETAVLTKSGSDPRIYDGAWPVDPQAVLQALSGVAIDITIDMPEVIPTNILTVSDNFAPNLGYQSSFFGTSGGSLVPNGLTVTNGTMIKFVTAGTVNMSITTDGFSGVSGSHILVTMLGETAPLLWTSSSSYLGAWPVNPQEALTPYIGLKVEITAKYFSQPPAIDMDGDGLPDTLLSGAQGDGLSSTTEDADSYNIDTDGDDIADIVIPK